MKTLVINLERETARLAHMRKVFGEQGLDFTVVKAVDAKLLSPEDLKAGRTGKPRFYELGAGEIACFLSHRKCWEIAAQSEDAYTIICEDDIFLGENASAIFGDASWIPADAGVVRLEACRPKTLIAKAAVSTVAGRKVHPLRLAHAGSGAYVVSRDAAVRLLRETTEFCDPLDQFLYSSEEPATGALEKYQMVPAPAIQEVFLRKDKLLGSSLLDERYSVQSTGKPRGVGKKILREIGRSRKKIARFFANVWTYITTENMWVRVHFK
ncbi:glycosyltransferase family 25 protein [Nitratireductor sp. B36]|uniref:glycosyltransferase family 25 protein n=1 Tax=Nitratireductor sp. B36 TaxID=2762059 RepID=UPI001E3BDC88|nr:glycosyltransferase family 25 protein [Nitratireductor sp. B36]MCC5779218.1 glycosyltransferase family 25 protein [Nitratireductor sp. B36]